MCNLQTLMTELLPWVEKPARYIGGEFGAVKKNGPGIELHICLAFPDLYEIGMSHLGLQLLYELLNRDPRIWVERVYLPHRDMESLLRMKHVPLFSLESKRPLYEFDVLGFSLQYELCATGVLTMLDLGRIPLLSTERRSGDPLVIGGGPLAFNPEPLADFFDAFLIGEGEELLLEFLESVIKAKRKKFERNHLLQLTAEIEGVYLPHLHGSTGKNKVKRRLMRSLEGITCPTRPVVPNLQVVHDRLSVEIMRGCVHGCRFCQAGYIYRPQRERSPLEIIKTAEEALKHSGYEEISLLSLSSADYKAILPLVQALKSGCAQGVVKLSLPSTRVDALHQDLLLHTRSAKKSGFTIAPEAGTQRLRNVINKCLTEEQILEGCRRLFDLGWKRLKLYFMIGLPTENDEDLEGIIDLIRKIESLAGRAHDITCSISTFVPKPHTPFQWCAQIEEEEIIRRQQLLRLGLKRSRIHLRFHDPFSSVLEGVLARGGRFTSKAIHFAFEAGCRLDAWPDKLHREIWLKALQSASLDLQSVLGAKDLEETLPWDHIDCGISPDFFRKEWEKAHLGQITQDCLSGSCVGCGICSSEISNRRSTEKTSEVYHITVSIKPPVEIKQIYRLRYEKRGLARFHAHLDLAKILFRAMRRASLPLAYSSGFNPQPRLSFGPPLQLGIESSWEYVDVALSHTMNAEELLAAINRQCPEGIRILEALPIDRQSLSIQAAIRQQSYLARMLPSQAGHYNLKERSPQNKDWRCWDVSRARRHNISKVILGEVLSHLEIEPGEISFSIRSFPDKASLKPFEIIQAVSALEPALFITTKTGVTWR